jgi:hypothetical protein
VLVVMLVFIRLPAPRALCVMPFHECLVCEGAREIKLAFTESKDHAASSL